MNNNLYKTGMICTFDELRIKQGLLPQNIANLCQCCNECCDMNCLYPSKVVKWKYCCPSPDECDECVRYVRSA